MPAPKQFARDSVLRDAMAVFWARGYEATSVRDLSDAMSINASSLYREFSSKRGLYLEALDLYRDEVMSQHMAMLLAPGAGLDAIVSYFHGTVDGLARGDWSRACLLVNAAVERGAVDPEVRNRVRAYVRGLERAFAVVLARAQDDGSLPADRDIEALAQFLGAVLQSLVVIGKGTRDAPRLRAVVNVALETLPR